MSGFQRIEGLSAILGPEFAEMLAAVPAPVKPDRWPELTDALLAEGLQTGERA